MLPFRLAGLSGFMLSVLLCANAAQAMNIQQFDKMAPRDKGNYIATLIIGAQKALIAEGRSDEAVKVADLFSKTLPGDLTTVGMGELDRNLDRALVADAKNVVKDPNARRISVEDAMAVTLKKNGIELPQSFFAVANDFQPKFAPQP